GGVLRLGLHRARALRLRLRGKGDGCQHQRAGHDNCEFAHRGLLRELGVGIWWGRMRQNEQDDSNAALITLAPMRSRSTTLQDSNVRLADSVHRGTKIWKKLPLTVRSWSEGAATGALSRSGSDKRQSCPLSAACDMTQRAGRYLPRMENKMAVPH